MWGELAPPTASQDPASLRRRAVGPLTVEVQDPQPVDRVVAGQRAQERDPARVGGHGDPARLAQGEAAGAGVLAGERRRRRHRPYSTATSRITEAARQTAAIATHNPAWIQVGRESANTRKPTLNAR